MSLFESLLGLLIVAAVLLRVSRRLNISYPTMLALAGAGVAALPFAPAIEIEPKLALALFIPPAVFRDPGDRRVGDDRRAVCAARSTSARDRVHAYAVWESLVVILNVLAFLLMGLQARVTLARLSGDGLSHALGVAGLVLLAVIVVRIVWAMIYVGALRGLTERFPALYRGARPSARIGLLVSWCGMRGLVTLATAFALPQDFPGRDTIVLSAFVVVFGTLVLQGLTVVPLIRLLGIEPDNSMNEELSRARSAMLRAALESIDSEAGPAAEALRREYHFEQEISRDESDPEARTEFSRLRRRCVAAQRSALEALRTRGEIAEDVYHRLEARLDLDEVSETPRDELTLEES
jgi:CPA1 family monovalent cation:H+ antiporter